MTSLRCKLDSLSGSIFCLDNIRIRPIQDDWDLWYATVECRLAPGQEDFVNPAGFSIGRAYLDPARNIPCIIWKEETRIGYIIFREWSDSNATGWSYYLDKDWQGKGCGRAAAQLAVQILKAAAPDKPIKLSAEASNEKAHRLYRSIGFCHLGEIDGDDMVFVY